MVEDFRDQNQGSSLTFSRREWEKATRASGCLMLWASFETVTKLSLSTLSSLS